MCKICAYVSPFQKPTTIRCFRYMFCSTFLECIVAWKPKYKKKRTQLAISISQPHPEIQHCSPAKVAHCKAISLQLLRKGVPLARGINRYIYIYIGSSPACLDSRL